MFNTTYHNSLCQAACYEAQADLNLFDELQTYHLSQVSYFIYYSSFLALISHFLLLVSGATYFVLNF